ncbi:hypothetical protein K8T06_12385 [bacterium]|nr:hypothetical protein [bacterium]
MAKDQFKSKSKDKSLTTRFTVLPLVDKGNEFLCVDANFQFLMVNKERLEEYTNMALPEVVNPKLHKEAIEAARQHLPADNKTVEKLRFQLKQKGPDSFLAELEKVMG